MICGNFQIMTFLFDSVDKQMTYFCQLGLVSGSVPGKPGQLLTSVHLHTSRWPCSFSCKTKEQQHWLLPRRWAQKKDYYEPLPQLVPHWLMLQRQLMLRLWQDRKASRSRINEHKCWGAWFFVSHTVSLDLLLQTMLVGVGSSAWEISQNQGSLLSLKGGEKEFPVKARLEKRTSVHEG